jgi:hypothetical protein
MSEPAQETAASGGEATVKPKGEATTYMVLQRDQSGAWKELGQHKARTARGAIAAYANGKDDIDGTFMAVPLRSWSPISVETQIESKLSFK